MLQQHNNMYAIRWHSMQLGSTEDNTSGLQGSKVSSSCCLLSSLSIFGWHQCQKLLELALQFNQAVAILATWQHTIILVHTCSQHCHVCLHTQF